VLGIVWSSPQCSCGMCNKRLRCSGLVNVEYIQNKHITSGTVSPELHRGLAEQGKYGNIDRNGVCTQMK
jgi:hypothetical protein